MSNWLYIVLTCGSKGMTYVTKPKDNNIDTVYPLCPSAPYAPLLCFVCTHLVVMCTAPLYSNILPPLTCTHPLPTFHLGVSEAHHHSSSGDQRGSLGGCRSSDDHGWILSPPCSSYCIQHPLPWGMTTWWQGEATKVGYVFWLHFFCILTSVGINDLPPFYLYVFWVKLWILDS